VVAQVSEDQLAVVVNVAAVPMRAAVAGVAAAMNAVVAEVESADRSRGQIQGTAKASFFIECVCPKNRKAAIQRRSQSFLFVSHSFWT
jgi:hypothetical protein